MSEDVGVGGGGNRRDKCSEEEKKSTEKRKESSGKSPYLKFFKAEGLSSKQRQTYLPHVDVFAGLVKQNQRTNTAHSVVSRGLGDVCRGLLSVLHTGL